MPRYLHIPHTPDTARRPLPRPQGRAGEAHRRHGRGQGVPAHPNRQFINMISYINKLNFQVMFKTRFISMLVLLMVAVAGCGSRTP